MPVSKPRLVLVLKFTDGSGAPLHVLKLIEYFRNHYDVVLLVGYWQVMADQAQALGIRVELAPELQGDATPIGFLRSIFRLKARLKALRPGLVHVHSPLAGVAARAACLMLKVPCLTTIHGWNFAPGLPWRRRLACWVLERAAALARQPLILVSEYDYRLAKKYGMGAMSHVNVIQNGIDDYPHKIAPTLGQQRQAKTMLMVARFEEQKSQDVLIQAAAKLTGEWHLLLVGDGTLRTRCETLVDRLGLSGRVQFTGQLPNPLAALEQAGIFVLLSRYEGLPLSILEAMRAALPVVACPVGGIPELVEEGVSGHLVSLDNLGGISQALQELLDNPDKAIDMGQAGRQRFLDSFQSARMLEHTARVYQRYA